MWDVLFIDANLATMALGAEPYGAIRNGALGIEGDRIAYVGPAAGLPGNPESLSRRVERLKGAWITPGLIDCHTHLVFAGERSNEFEMRLGGVSYKEIAKAGGGIASTVKATRGVSLEALIEASRPRLIAMAMGGVTTVEIKSGYGLDQETEFKMLEAATLLGRECDVRVRRTFLAMHALPEEYASDRAAYVRLVCEELLPEAARRGLVDSVDAFCEGIGFTLDEVRRLFDAATALDLPVKLHAEQLSNFGGAALAANYQALSADHLEYVSEVDIEAMAKNGVVAVLLPGAFYFLKETRKPPVGLLRKHGVAIAVASDCNPGTSPMVGSSLVMNMACTFFALTPEEALAGMTRNAAAALGLSGETGTLEAGKAADVAIWRVSRPAEIVYWIGAAAPERVFSSGRELVL